jgi:hypothetical protein
MDHASRFMYLKCHYSTGGAEAVEGKQRFEQFANTQGVKIKAYRADNGIMAKKEYMHSIEINQQTITLSGVNNHSQNGIAERNIRTVSDRARSMLLHAIEKWPEAITLELWPFALKMAVDIHNATPGKSGLSPEEIFTKQKARQDRLVDFHPFGCPVFVLDPKLQQGHKLPKWQPRARQAIYLGHSPKHAQTVPIVLNPRTGLCSPQYHVVFDDTFSTTTASTTNKLPDNWSELFTHSRVDCFEGEDDTTIRPSLAQEWHDTEITSVDQVTEQHPIAQPDPVSRTVQQDTEEGTAGTVTPASEGGRHISSTVASASEGGQHTSVPQNLTTEGGQYQLRAGIPSQSEQSVNEAPPSSPAPDSRPSSTPSIAQQPPRTGWNPSHGHNTRYRARFQANVAGIQSSAHGDHSPVECQFAAMVAAVENIHVQEDGTYNFIYPSAFLSHQEKDTLHYGEMLQSEDRDKFVEAMQKEISGLKDILQVVQRS